MFGLIYALIGLFARTSVIVDNSARDIESLANAKSKGKETFYDSQGKERLTSNCHRISRRAMDSNGDIGIKDLETGKLLVNYSDIIKKEYNKAFEKANLEAQRLNDIELSFANKNNHKCYIHYYVKDQLSDYHNYKSFIQSKLVRISDGLDICDDSDVIRERRFKFIVDTKGDYGYFHMPKEDAAKYNWNIINHKNITNENGIMSKDTWDYESDYLLNYAKSVGAIL